MSDELNGSGQGHDAATAAREAADSLKSVAAALEGLGADVGVDLPNVLADLARSEEMMRRLERDLRSDENTGN